MTTEHTQTKAGEAFVLEFHAEPEYVSTARTFSVAVGRALGLNETQLEELKLAVSEACTLCIAGRAPGSPESVRVSIESVDGGLALSVRDPAPRAPLVPGEWSEDVIRALFPDARVRTDEGVEIAFSVPRSAQE
ncbi:MAG: ATP-binding protein [Actinomycetota bacterium]